MLKMREGVKANISDGDCDGCLEWYIRRNKA